MSGIAAQLMGVGVHASWSASGSMRISPIAALALLQEGANFVLVLCGKERLVFTQIRKTKSHRGWLPPCLGGRLPALHEACNRLVICFASSPAFPKRYTKYMGPCVILAVV